jgi:hypothetical protein
VPLGVVLGDAYAVFVGSVGTEFPRPGACEFEIGLVGLSLWIHESGRARALVSECRNLDAAAGGQSEEDTLEHAKLRVGRGLAEELDPDAVREAF